jgi:Signal recognition particle 9 kDa protein (SRP9)
VSKPKPAPNTSEQTSTTTTTTATFATLTLKTFNPATGICLKYKTNKAAEVGRLISGLGKLAAGVKIGAEEVPVAAAVGQDVEMSDVQAQPQPAASQGQTQTQTQTQTQAAGGGKKKKGKGKK